jgi:hypothetical protein
MEKREREAEEEPKQQQLVLEEMGTVEFFQTEDDPRPLMRLIPIYKRPKPTEQQEEEKEEELKDRIKLLQRVYTQFYSGQRSGLENLFGYCTSLEAIITRGKQLNPIPKEWIQFIPELEKYQKQ